MRKKGAALLCMIVFLGGCGRMKKQEETHGESVPVVPAFEDEFT